MASIPLAFLVRMGMRRIGWWGRGENSLVEEVSAARVVTEVLEADPEVYLQACDELCNHQECLRFRRRADEVALDEFGATHFDANPVGVVLPAPAGPIVQHGQAMLPMVEVAEVPIPTLGVNVRNRNGRACNHPDRYRLNPARRNGFRKLLLDTMKIQFPCVINGVYKPYSDTDIAAMHKALVMIQKMHGVRTNHIAENVQIVLSILTAPSSEEQLGMTIYRSRAIQTKVWQASSTPKVHGPLWNILGTAWKVPSWGGRQN